jgi:MFS family permease
MAGERRFVLLAGAGTIVASLPVPLTGALAVLLQEDLGFGETGLGVLVALHFLVAAVASLPAARAIHRAGVSVVLALSVLLTALVMTGIAVAVSAWWQLVLLLAICGIGNAGAQLATNQLIVTKVRRQHQGLAFGLKQAAVPLAALIAGLALPMVGLTIGWRYGFWLGALLAGVVALVVLLMPRVRSPGGPRLARTQLGQRPLILLAVAAGFGGAAGQSFGPFLVGFAVDRGFDSGTAGLVLACGATAGALTRIAAGWFADRIGHGMLLIMSGLLAIGAVGLALLAFLPTAHAVVVGSMLGFAGAWGWAGLLLLSVSRVSGNAAAEAMGLVAIGPLVGMVVGPPLFGLLIDLASYQVAWAALSASAGRASGLEPVGRQKVRAARATPRASF